MAWRLYGARLRLELPARAPPINLQLLMAMAGWAVLKNDFVFAASLMLTWHCLLRAGELFAVKPEHISISRDKGVVALPHTKTSQRSGAWEAVTIYWPLLAIMLGVVLKLQRSRQQIYLWDRGPVRFRKIFQDALDDLDLQRFNFKPYGLRRGGATHYFRECGALDKTLLRGRWNCPRAAKVYITDGLAVRCEMQFTKPEAQKLAYYAAAVCT